MTTDVAQPSEYQNGHRVKSRNDPERIGVVCSVNKKKGVLVHWKDGARWVKEEDIEPIIPPSLGSRLSGKEALSVISAAIGLAIP